MGMKYAVGRGGIWAGGVHPSVALRTFRGIALDPRQGWTLSTGHGVHNTVFGSIAAVQTSGEALLETKTEYGDSVGWSV